MTNYFETFGIGFAFEVN